MNDNLLQMKGNSNVNTIKVLENVMDKCLENGSRDNMTAIFIEFKGNIYYYAYVWFKCLSFVNNVMHVFEFNKDGSDYNNEKHSTFFKKQNGGTFDRNIF